MRAAQAFTLAPVDGHHSWELTFVYDGVPGVLPNPLATAMWDDERKRYVTDACHRDDLVAQAMVLLALRRLTEGWSRKRAAQELPIWGGKKPMSSLPNLWAEEITAAKLAGGRLAGAPAHLNHEDNYYSFNQFYICDISCVRVYCNSVSPKILP